MNFTIDEEYCTSITVYKEWSIFQDKTELTDDELVYVLLGKDKCTSISSADHPEYAKFRNMLGELGYIEINRNCWNGDDVLKPFTVNGFKFKKGERFLSGAAMGTHIEVRKKHGR